MGSKTFCDQIMKRPGTYDYVKTLDHPKCEKAHQNKQFKLFCVVPKHTDYVTNQNTLITLE